MSEQSALAEIITSFRGELPERVFNRLCVCIGPETRAKLLREQSDKRHAAFVRLDPPKPWNPPVVAPWAHKTQEDWIGG